jgi:hypothetical protein
MQTLLKLIPSALLLGFILWMYHDCVGRLEDRNRRLRWALFFLFASPLAAVFYYFVVYREKRITSVASEEGRL